MPERLDRDIALEFAIPGGVDGAEAAAADQIAQLDIAAQRALEPLAVLDFVGVESIGH